MMGKKELHFVHSSQSYGGSKSSIPKNVAKVPNLNADLVVGSRFGPLRRQKRLKSQIFDGLYDGPKKIWILAILARVISG